MVSLGAKEEVGGDPQPEQSWKDWKERGGNEMRSSVYLQRQKMLWEERGWGDQTHAGTEMMTSEIIRRSVM